MSKNKLSSRLLAAVLAVLMVFTMLPFAAFAETTEPGTEGSTEGTTEGTTNAVTTSNVKLVVKDGEVLVDGANVDYTVKTAGEKTSAGKGTTNKNGELTISVNDADLKAGLIKISGTVSKEGYTDSTFDNAVSADNLVVSVNLAKIPTIKNIEVEGVTAPYKDVGNIQLVTIKNDNKDKDKYSYSIVVKNEAGKVIGEYKSPAKAVAHEVGKYTVMVTVHRDGYTDYIAEPVISEITKIKLNTETLNLNACANKNLVYNGKMQELVNVESFNPRYLANGNGTAHFVNKIGRTNEVHWYIAEGNGEFNEVDKPEAKHAGIYRVRVEIHPNNAGAYYSYETKDSEANAITVEIASSNKFPEGVTVSANNKTYTGKPIELLKVEDEDKILYYSLSNGKDAVWTKDIPEKIDAGSYKVYVRVKDGKNYDIQEVNVTIQKAAAEIKWGDAARTKKITSPNETVTFDLDASVKKGDSKTTITYTIEKGTNAKIEGTKLIVTGVGKVTVKATSAASNNYNSATTTTKFTVEGAKGNTDGNWVKFMSDKASAILNVDGKKVYSRMTAHAADDDDLGKITYSLSGTNALEIDKNGVITLKEENEYGVYKLEGELFNAISQGKSGLEITVKAVKSAYSDDDHKFPENSATYTLLIKYGSSPVFTDNKGYKINTIKSIEIKQAGVYSLLVIDDVPGYTVGRFKGGAICDEHKFYWSGYMDDGLLIPNIPGVYFSGSIDINGEDDAPPRYITYKNNTTGEISQRVNVTEPVDGQAPQDSQLKIEFPELNFAEKIFGDVIYKFYNPKVKIKFIVEDEVRPYRTPIVSIDWSFTKDAENDPNVPKHLVDSLNSSLKEPDIKVAGNNYYAELELSASEAQQLRGKIGFSATDGAGNKSNEVYFTENGSPCIIVVDTINANVKAEANNINFKNGDVVEFDGKHYFDNDIEFKFTVNEANFFADDFEKTIKITKNGEEIAVPEITWKTQTPPAVPEGQTAPTQNAEGQYYEDIHEATFVLSGDGEYVVSLNGYKDPSMLAAEKSGEKVDGINYTSDPLVIDKTAPEVSASFDKAAQTVTFTVVEHNFRSKDLTVTGNIVDLQGNVVISAADLTEILRNAAWKTNGDTHTFTYDFKNNGFDLNGIYNLKLDYTDIALNKANQFTIDEFIIDHAGPTDLKITYSKSLAEKALEVISLGFYKADVTITFSAKDTASRVDHFTWTYEKQKGSSDSNKTEIKETILKVDKENGVPKHDKGVSSASVTVTAKEYGQLRGKFTVMATDTYANNSDKITDDKKVIIVDTVSPEISVEYSPAASNEEIFKETNKHYYNGDIVATFKIKEANFFAEDVKASYTVDGTKHMLNLDWKDEGKDIHVAKYTFHDDGDYVVTVDYTDKSENKMKTYTSDTMVIDTIAPVIDVTYENENLINTVKDSEEHDRKYFDDIQTAVVKVTEHNFNGEDVKYTIVAKDVTGKELTNLDELNTKTEWTVDSTGDVHTMKITYPGDANYIFDVEYTDLATNKAEDYKEDYFTVDKTAPTNLKINYTKAISEVLEVVTFGFYEAPVKVTITADDNISGVHSFMYSYINAPGVSGVNAELIDQLIEAANIKYSEDRKTATASFDIPKAVLDANHQFNGSVTFTAFDRAENDTELKDSQRIVVDNISPVAKISYNDPVNKVGDISYYAGDINVTVGITEANFYKQDVKVLVSKDNGGFAPVSVSWKDNNVDSHVGTFTLHADGDYLVKVIYKDRSSNEMKTYESKKLVIDTKIETPTITVNGAEGNGLAFGDKVVPAVSFRDQNFENYELTLTRTRFDKKNVDVRPEFVAGNLAINAKGGSGVFDKFEKIAENDGIYTLTVKMTDRAKHSSEKSITFTVNRFGSVYSFNDALTNLVKDGGAYVKGVKEDLVITEYNPDKLVEDSVKIVITRDGKPLDNIKYDISPVVNNNVTVGQSGWFEYNYTISKSNFKEDGIYKIFVASEDNTGNAPENTSFEDKNMLFRVDSTTPELTSVIGLEKPIINAQKVEVEYTIYDTIGLKEVRVYVNDKLVGEPITDFSLDLNNYEGSLVLNESSDAQRVRFEIVDKAGNVTNTDSKNFTSEYEFNKTVTVSTNFFVRWYANKPLFWGSVSAVILAVAAIIVVVVVKARKKDDEA